MYIVGTIFFVSVLALYGFFSRISATECCHQEGTPKPFLFPGPVLQALVRQD